MQSLFQPPPEVLAFLFLKKFLYLELILFLALIRMVVARRGARFFAFLAFLAAFAGIAAIFGPALMNIYSGPIFIYSAQLSNAVQGLAMPLAASVLFALSALMPGRRWAVLDGVHVLLFASLATLWWLTQ